MGLVQMRTPFVGTNIAVPFSDIYLFLWGRKHSSFGHSTFCRHIVPVEPRLYDKISFSFFVDCSKLHFISFLEFPLKSQSHAALPPPQQGNLFEKNEPLHLSPETFTFILRSEEPLASLLRGFTRLLTYSCITLSTITLPLAKLLNIN